MLTRIASANSYNNGVNPADRKHTILIFTLLIAAFVSVNAHHPSQMALEVCVKAAVGAPNVLGDCMLLLPIPLISMISLLSFTKCNCFWVSVT